MSNRGVRLAMEAVGVDSATALAGSQTVTIDTAAFDLLVRAAGCARTRDLRAAGLDVTIAGPKHARSLKIVKAAGSAE